MRLLNTSTLVPQEFEHGDIPPFAILSHRWGKEEITLQDLEQGITNKEGFKKVQRCCERAKSDGFDYAWIDTCCINKTSSAELSEAINSMYLWYYQADRCYAYLVDVPSKCKIEDSEWFTRGWTLQELLAPSEVHFVDEHWNDLGTRTGLQEVISGCTGIPISILSGHNDLETASIAQRMSWAAKRKTQRLEDCAYCLMGIFGINMPLLYGEGERAFIRLQQEIMRVSDDPSLFAWRCSDARGGLLATSPEAFKDSKDVVPFNHFNDPSDPPTVSSRGIHLSVRFLGLGPGGLGLAILQCTNRDGNRRPIAIYVRDQSWTMESFERVKSNVWELPNLARFRSTQFPRRRLCIRTGRLTPLRRRDSVGIGGGAAFFYEYEYSRRELDGLMGTDSTYALSMAVEKGSLDEIWLLLTRSDIEIEFRRTGHESLLSAVKLGNEGAVKLLLARAAQGELPFDTSDMLKIAVEQGNERIHESLLNYQVYISGTTTSLGSGTYNNRLMRVLRSGREASVQPLWQRLIRLNITNRQFDRSPLWRAPREQTLPRERRWG